MQKGQRKNSLMSEETFSGFMPMISQVYITEEMTMINTEGDLVPAHSFTMETRDGQKNVYSINKVDLMKLYFVIAKVINSD